MSDHDRPLCPVCLKHSQRDALEAEGLIISGIKAFLDMDVESTQLVYEQLTGWHAHVAISLYALLVADMAEAFHTDVDETLDEWRSRIHDSLAQA